MEQQHQLFEGKPPATLIDLEAAVVGCRACPRLVEWREQVASEKRAAFANDEYWGRPVPGFGDPNARVVVIGLAPAAHGANRTGRMFTGDRSGEWLYRAMFRSGFASTPRSVSRDDGLTLTDAWITAPVRCAPPQNKPTVVERNTCSAWFDAELDLLPNAQVFVVLGQYGYQALWSHLDRAERELPKPRPAFGHCDVVELGNINVVMSYHPSQQNTFTGKLTEPMLDAVFDTAKRMLSTKKR